MNYISFVRLVQAYNEHIARPRYLSFALCFVAQLCTHRLTYKCYRGHLRGSAGYRAFRNAVHAGSLSGPAWRKSWAACI